MSAVLNHDAENVYLERNTDIVKEYGKILDLTTLSMNLFANIYYKDFSFLEPSDIDLIKESLNNYVNNSKKIREFKRELIADLTDFQKEIKNNQIQKVSELANQKLMYENQLKILNIQKQKHIISCLSSFKWPFNNETRKYNNKINNLQNKSKYYAQKMIGLQKMRPSADEKEILLYQMRLKDKFKQLTKKDN